MDFLMRLNCFANAVASFVLIGEKSVMVDDAHTLATVGKRTPAAAGRGIVPFANDQEYEAVRVPCCWYAKPGTGRIRRLRTPERLAARRAFHGGKGYPFELWITPNSPQPLMVIHASGRKCAGRKTAGG
jgi:hypothetical protein